MSVDRGKGMWGPIVFALIDDFPVDCVISADHQYETDISQFPVESGAMITDNVLPRPVVVTMEVVVTNTPIHPVIIAVRDDVENSVVSVYQKLIKIRDDREPVTIRTPLDTFKNMVLKNLGIPQTVDTGDAIRFTTTWQQIQVVTNTRSTRVAIPTAKRDRTFTAQEFKLGPSANTNIAIDTRTNKWLDPRINEWRLRAVPGSQGNPFIVGDPAVPVGEWRLNRGCPDSVDPKAWAANTIDGNRLLEQVLALQNSGKAPFADAETQASLIGGSQNIIVVPPGKTHLEAA